MYLKYWSFDRNPFDNVPDSSFFYRADSHYEGLSRLQYAAQNKKGCALLSGDVGVGKTILCKVMLEQINGFRFDVVIVSNPCLNAIEFFQDMLLKLESPIIPDTKIKVLHALHDRLCQNIHQHKYTILIIDEAHLLSDDLLEEVRLLLNFQSESLFMLTILLVGQQELIEKVKNIRPLRQRVAVKYHLRPFCYEESEKYILFRQKKAGARKNVFSKQAIDMVYDHSNGTPRLINHLCDLALLIGKNEKKRMISSGIIKEILNDETVF